MTTGETITCVIWPSWLSTDRRVNGTEWVEHWAAVGQRKELRHMAQVFVSSGFTKDGRQVMPKSLTFIAKDAGKSPASAKRFMARARELGMLREVGRKYLSEGKRATPMHELVVPAEPKPVPESLVRELGPLVETFPDKQWPAPVVWWSPDPQPSWATAKSDPYLYLSISAKETGRGSDQSQGLGLIRPSTWGPSGPHWRSELTS